DRHAPGQQRARAPRGLNDGATGAQGLRPPLGERRRRQGTGGPAPGVRRLTGSRVRRIARQVARRGGGGPRHRRRRDRKSTRLNSSHVKTSYAVLSSKKKSRMCMITKD